MKIFNFIKKIKEREAVIKERHRLNLCIVEQEQGTKLPLLFEYPIKIISFGLLKNMPNEYYGFIKIECEPEWINETVYDSCGCHDSIVYKSLHDLYIYYYTKDIYESDLDKLKKSKLNKFLEF